MQTLSAGRGGRWRQTDATMDVESLGDISVTSSVERQAMREQLDAVRHTLNSLASGAQPSASGVNGLATGGLDTVLSDIASKLTNIEGLYSSLTNKLEKVDLRMEDSERHIKDLQHFSASAIHETARLVDYVGAHATPNTRAGSQGGVGPTGVSAGSALRARHMAAAGIPTTPPPAAASPSRTGITDYVPGHINGTLQQHAAQIHKLIAGLDFLEAHIIRQDQVVEGLQKQLVSVARDVASTSAATGSRSPSELSLRMHDMSELLNKLRSHMYKVEKKSSSNEQTVALLNERMQAIELSAASGSGQQQREAEDLQREQDAAMGPSVLELAAAQGELRDMVQGLCRDILDLRDQLQAQAQEENASPPGLSSEDGAEMQRQLAFLMSQVPSLVAENNELKAFAAHATTQLSELSSALQKQQQQPGLGSDIMDSPDLESKSRATPDGPLAKLDATVAAMQEQLVGLDERLQNAASRDEVERLSAAVQADRRSETDPLAELGSTVAMLQEQVQVLGKQLHEAVARDELEKLSAVVEALTAEQAHQESAIADAVAKVRPVAMGGPAAAVLAAEVTAAARANLEEQFGQLRHRVEVTATAAEEAEEAARSSAESAAAALALAASVESAGQKASRSAADLQESVLAMMAGVEQEQAAFKQQLALLAAQISEEQGAISSGLLQVQEQVATAASAAMDAATCAQLVQEQQAASGQQERDSAETLQAIQAELREQVASVMERLKERVEEGMQQMDAQVSAVSEQLSGAIRAEQFEAALREVRGAASDSAERCELALASLDELRSELILLTGQQDVVQSRIEALEAAVGVDPRARTNMARTSASGADDGQITDDGTAEDLLANIAAGAGASGPGGLLDLVADLRSRVGGLEGMIEAAAVNTEQLRDELHGHAQDAQDGIQQATAQLISDLQGLSAAVDGMDERVASAAADCVAMAAITAATQQGMAEQTGATSELATRLQEVQVRLENEVVARVQETAAAVGSLSARIERDYINREQLGAIFQARADMKRAVDELSSVFTTGRLLRTVSSDETANPASGGTSATEPRGEGASGALSPRLVSALEDLAGKQAELEHQVQLALYRTEGAVRQEQLTGIQQAMMTLEMQFRRLGAVSQQPQQPQSQAAAHDATVPVAGAASADMSELRARVAALEAALASNAAVVPTTDVAAARGAGVAATEPVASDVTCGNAVRVRLSTEDPADSSTPVKLRLHVEGAAKAVQAASSAERTAPDLAPGGPAEEAGEPSQSQMLPGTGLPDATPAVLAVAEELQQLGRTVCDLEKLGEMLQYELAAESAERLRLAEALADMQERLDMQVNATASTVAMVATLATDHRQHVRLQVRVGDHDAQDLSTLAAAVSTLSARVDAAEDSLAAAFVVRTPRSPTRANAAAAYTVAMAAEAAAGDGVGEGGATDEGPGEDDDEELRPALGLMVPVLPREAEQQIAALHSEYQKLEAALGVMSGRMDSLEAADALEEVRAAASEIVLDAIPGLVSQQVAVVREEMAALVSRQGEQLLELAGQAARDAAEAVLAVREAASEAVAAREGAAEGFAAQTMAAEAALARDMGARAALDAAEAAAREAASEAHAAREAAVEAAAEAGAARKAAADAAGAREAAIEAMSAREAAMGAQAAAEAAVGEAMEAARTAQGAVVEAEISREAAAQAVREIMEMVGDANAHAAVLSSSPPDEIKDDPLSGDAAKAIIEMAIAAAREAAAEVAATVAREMAEDTGREAVENAAFDQNSMVRDVELTSSVLQLATDVDTVRMVVGSLTDRLNDVDTLRDQLEALAAQVRDSAVIAALDADAASNLTGSQMPPSTPNAAAVASIFTPAATAMVILPAHTPRGSAASGASPSGPRPATSSQQATFLARLVDVVKRQSSRLHAQYSDAEETSMALAQVDHTLEEAEAHLGDVLDANSPAFAETLVTVLEQVAALRYIGSQTHPAVQQMVLEHENRLEQIADQLKTFAAGTSAGRASSQPSASADSVTSVSGRVSRLEAEVGRVAGQQAALDGAVTEMLTAVDNIRHHAAMAAAATSISAGDDNGVEPPLDTVAASAAGPAVAALEMAGLAAKVRLLDESFTMQLSGLRQELLAELAAGGGNGSSDMDMLALDSKVSQLHTAATAMRTRLLAVQEYVDSTQGMIKDMHVALGGLHRRVDTLEGTSGASGRSSRVSGSGSLAAVDSCSIRELQSDLNKLDGRLLTVESSALEAAHALAGLKGLAPRVTEAEARLADTSTKLAGALGGSTSSAATPVIPALGPGMALPVIAGAVRALERRVGGRLEATYTALDMLTGALSEAGKIQAESTTNPFKAISAAVNNPVVVALDKKIESMRAEVLAAATALLEDLRRDQQQQQIEARLQSPDTSMGARSSYGGSGGLSFRG